MAASPKLTYRSEAGFATTCGGLCSLAINIFILGLTVIMILSLGVDPDYEAKEEVEVVPRGSGEGYDLMLKQGIPMYRSYLNCHYDTYEHIEEYDDLNLCDMFHQHWEVYENFQTEDEAESWVEPVRCVDYLPTILDEDTYNQVFEAILNEETLGYTPTWLCPKVDKYKLAGRNTGIRLNFSRAGHEFSEEQKAMLADFVIEYAFVSQNFNAEYYQEHGTL